MLRTNPMPLLALLTLVPAGSAMAGRPVQALQEKYSVKVAPNMLAPAEFTLKVNGQVVGTYDDTAQVDITDRMKAGKNTFTVTWRATSPITNTFAKTTLTIGVQRAGKWSTVLTATCRKAAPKGTRTISVTAK